MVTSFFSSHHIHRQRGNANLELLGRPRGVTCWPTSGMACAPSDRLWALQAALEGGWGAAGGERSPGRGSRQVGKGSSAAPAPTHTHTPPKGCLQGPWMKADVWVTGMEPSYGIESSSSVVMETRFRVGL